MDNLRKETDKELKRLEDDLERIYKDAEGDLREKWTAYMDRAEKRVASFGKKYEEAVKSGDADAIAAAKKQLQEKIAAATFRDKQFQDMVDGVTERMAHVNQIALEYVNGKMPDMYRYNYNGTLTEVTRDAKKAGIDGVAFNMLDEKTVENMVKRGEVKLPAKKIDIPKDKAWNKKALNAQMLQGIIQGESIPQISKRLSNVTDMDKEAAIRNARTMTTEAENAGRLASMEQAEESGLQYEKVWMSTHDDRTRESHALMDGEAVPLDEKFSNGLEYPGDPNGEPEEVYNCRCSLVRKLVGYKGHSIKANSYEPTFFDDVKAEDAKAAPAASEKEAEEALAAFEEKQQKAEAETVREFTQEETDMLEWYVSGDGMYINNALRGISDVKLTSEEMQKVKTLDNAIAKNVVENKELYRAVDASAVFGNMSATQYDELRSALLYGAETNTQKQVLEKAEKAIGKDIVDDGFLSTTTDKDTALNWGDFTGSEKPITIVFDVGEGIHGADLSFLDIEDAEQNEVLLERGLTYAMTSFGIENVYDDGDIIGKEIVVYAKLKNKKE